MPLALAACALLAAMLSWLLVSERVGGLLARVRAELARLAASRGAPAVAAYDPGRELRAEQRARALLRSCVNDEEWAMYRELGFLRVWGGLSGARRRGECAEYAYLIYPHKPLIAYLPQTGTILGEYCVTFAPESGRGLRRLPDADDVLAKWMLLSGDEARLLAEANVHLPGRQVDPAQVRSDLAALSRWERRRLGAAVAAERRPDTLPAP